MALILQLAKHMRDVHFGGNWTVSNLREQLSTVDMEVATTKIGSFNTIATLVFHINYFVVVAARVLEGGPLEGDDKLSFAHPPLETEDDWQAMLAKTWADAERFASLVEVLPEDRLWEPFGNEKYGSYYRNIQGIIEHTHYHLGQIAIIKKLVGESREAG